MYRSTARAGGASIGGRRRRVAAAVAVAGLALTGAGLLTAGAANAATADTVSDATFTWGLSGTANAGAFFGGCNFLSAGLAGDNGSSAVWTQTTPSPGYASQSGNVTVLKPDTAGNYAQPTWATKCQGPDGKAVTTATNTGSEVQIGGGTGTVDPDAGTASISWTGSFTSVFYGGLVYWSATDPTLTVKADGTGTVTASLSGYAASMSDPTQWAAIPASTVTLANLSGVQVTASGITVTPDYKGVAITPAAGASPQVQTGDNWGSFPADFIDFQNKTGEGSYWYSSGLNDADKVADPISVGYSAAPTQTAPVVTTQPKDASAAVNGTATFTAAASGDPTPTVQWQLLAPGSSTWQNYPGATDTTFDLVIHAQGYDGSKVRAVFTNAAGSATTDAVNLSVTTTPPPAGDNTEQITATVPNQGPAGEFTLTVPANAAVTMSEATSHGSYLESTGDLQPVTVTDTRTGGPTWSVSGQVGDFNSGALSGKYLGWTPGVATAGAGATAGAAVAPGISAGNGLTDASTLASATAGHDSGSASLGAGLDLQVPASTPAGTYTSTLTLTALS